jgi:endonuclease YncB( thermonuclease family)
VGLYEYRAEVLRVVDGDTIWLAWKDYGDGLKVHGGSTSATALSYRLAGINAYEKSLRYGTTAEEKVLGLEATAWLKGLIEDSNVLLKSVEAGAKGGFGRYLAYVFLDNSFDPDRLDPLNADNCVNRMLLDKGYAEVSKYEDGAMYEGLGYPREGE